MTTFGTNWKLYINGQCVQEKTSSANPVILYGNIYIGEKQALYNDFRIYDHCLSPKEVKEISKGLILHYPLNSIINNNILLNSAAYNGTTNWSGEVSVDSTGFYGTPCFVAKRTNTTSSSRTFVTHPSILNQVSSWTPGTKFTISGWYYIVSSDFNVTANPFIRWQNSSNMVDTGFNITVSDKKDTWVRFEKTFSVPDAFKSNPFTSVNFYMAAFSAGGTSTIKFSQLKLELGDVATAWCPNSEESFYTHLKPSNIIHDCSGYQNNGTINGSLSCSADSPRYNKSCKFGSGIIGTTSGFASAQSYTFWANVIDKTAQIVFVDGASKLGFGISSGYFLCNTEGGTSTVYSISNLTIGWHHFAVVNNLLYIDGVLQENRSDINNYWLYSGSMLEIGNRSNGNSYPWKGQISDFRVYATALSAEDIKELYNTSCIINS